MLPLTVELATDSVPLKLETPPPLTAELPLIVDEMIRVMDPEF